MAAQWLEELAQNGIAYGSKVKFLLPTAEKIVGTREIEFTDHKEYEGTVIRIKQYQLTVNVPGIGECRVHPDMCKPVNVSVLLLQDVR